MPTTKIYLEDIEEIIPINEFLEKAPYIGVEVEETGEDYIRLEYTPNRPDYGFYTGILKSLEGLLEKKTGLIKYTASEPSDNQYGIHVEQEAINIRPVIMGFLVEDLSLTDRMIEYLINFQEDLHNGLGRNRRKASIGIHDADKIRFPIYYRAVDSEYSFIPLDEDREMSIKEIITKTEKGQKYGGLVVGQTYTVLEDSTGNTLSLPPIINSRLTQVTENTNRLFIDITGTDEGVVTDIANLLASALQDIGGRVTRIPSIYPEGVRYKAPTLTYTEINVSIEYIHYIIGLEIGEGEIIRSLERMRYRAESRDGSIRVTIPPYRIDILHPIDIVEDVAIGMGLWRLAPSMDKMYFSMGSLMEETIFKEKLAEILVGMGLLEVVNLTLISDETQRTVLGEDVESVRVEKSKTPRDTLRTSLIPGLLETLRLNNTSEHPIKMFEIGTVVRIENGAPVERDMLGIILSDYSVNYGDGKAVIDTLLDLLGIRGKVRYGEPKRYCRYMLRGRAGALIAKDGEVGIISEIHPEILTKMGIEFPAVVAELDIHSLIKLYQDRQ